MEINPLNNPTTGTTTTKKGGSGRNSEKRRERSKVAARCRRSKESEIFSELGEFLPLPENTRNSLDKASVMRLILSDLKLRHMMQRVFSDADGAVRKTVDDTEVEIAPMLNNAMGGFVLVMSTEGDIIYASDSITTHLGLAQVEVMGLSIYDFSHPCDHGDIKELLLMNKKENDENNCCSRSSSFRMKCTITARGRNVHLRAASYKVIDFTGRMFSGNANDPDGCWFVGIGEPLLHPSDVEIPLNKQTFLTRHSPDMKCEFVDDNIKSFLGYSPDDLIGKSVFDFHHASDGAALGRAFKSLYTKGQSVTERYRFLAKHGGWVWVITQATLMQPSNGSKPNSIVCLNFVTSGVENANEIMSCVQKERPVCKPFKVVLPDFKKASVEQIRAETNDIELKNADKENAVPEIIPESKPITSTKTVIAPRTDDMDSGFLMPLDNDNTLIVSKEEPEDLTHLAPIAGDACVPLDQQIPLLDNLLKELEEANVPFSYNGYEIDVNYNDLPQLEMPVPSSPPAPEIESDDSEVGDSTISVSTNSPLFLNSDPPMVSSPGSKSSLLSPFQLSPNPVKSRRNYSERSSSNTSCSSYEMHQSPDSGSGYEDSRSPLPGLVGLSLQEESFRGAILMDGHLNDPGSCSSTRSYSPCDYHVHESSYTNKIPEYTGAFVTLPDGRKFPVVATANPNEFVCAGDPFTQTTKRNISPNEERDILLNNKQTSLNPKKRALTRQDDISIHGNIVEAKQSNPILNQLVITSVDNDIQDGVMKGGGPLLWNWDSVIQTTKGTTPTTLESPKSLKSSCGPPLAKSARFSEVKEPAYRSLLPPTMPSINSPTKVPWYGGLCRNKQLGTFSAGVANSSKVPTTTTKGNLSVEANREMGIGIDLGNKIKNSGSGMEHDLRNCLEQLLATGQGNKVTEIMSWLRTSASSMDDRRPKPQVKPPGGSLEGQNVHLGLLSKVPSPNYRKRDSTGIMAKNGNSARIGFDLSQQLPGLHELTRQDCEVNAPLNGASRLLNGAELLTALEYDNSEDPFA